MKQKSTYDRLAVGVRLQERRRQLGWTRSFVADRVGIGEKYYADIERGCCGMSIETLLGVTRLYNMTMDDLIYGEKKENQKLKRDEVLVENLRNLPEEAQNCCIEMLFLFMKGIQSGESRE